MWVCIVYRSERSSKNIEITVGISVILMLRICDALIPKFDSLWCEGSEICFAGKREYIPFEPIRAKL